MAVVIASDIGKDIAGSPLMRGVSFKLERRHRMTLSGRNGAGKTTLLRMIAGQASVDVGELSFQKGTKIALHDQRPPREQDLTLRDYVLSGAREIVAVEEELARLEQRMADGDYEESTLNAYARAQARLEHFGGYRWRDNAQSMLHGLGFKDDDLDRELSTFSGGQLTRGSLARALAGGPDLLLLDEPTNHLDIASLEWLEQYLVTMDAAVVLVAHDRWFLEAVGTAVLEMEAGRSRFFSGPWHKWRQEQAARELALGRAIDKQQAEIARLEKFVERFRAKATKARQAQSRVKRLERIERIERDPRDTESLAFQFKTPERAGRVIFELDDGRIEVPGKVLLEHAELWLERGEHVALVGPNGTGKTTLIDTLAGQRPLPAGKLRTGHNIQFGYLSQHAENLGETGSVLDAAQRATRLTPNKARALLGRFLFSGEDAQKPLVGLSGGERQRLSLAILVSSGANVLILDEPTNHLDVESREALEDALSGFEGSLLLVSHDRALLDAVGTRTIAIEDGRLNSYEGGWADYVRVRDERRVAEAAARNAAPAASKSKPAKTNGAAPKAKANGGGPAPAAAKPARSKNALREARRLEREIESAEAALSELEAELADPAAWADSERTAASSERHAAAKRAVEELYARYERVAD
ncbi:ABC-F family ATP-binding cassette domain-containing protein [Conexibacter woesei]|uniref:ABC transporter related protein n=1 Tax=Conexibacter woesei (strain DSM 14684 / CCUG 47730 / CIP 108061 / JCM 11494 / NBRC 100937 / ID131577) TaxID=469383 RepID=D3F8W6_CONWI|nr:ABC-F family ATP-binding cassette domain-containing protein [Conexibacter woesei]ADB52961.1 ABC transporter related protein [Conexibacter woesei DSM 14684]